MIRTTVNLPEDLHAEIRREARARRTSMGSLMRQALESLVKKGPEERDPIFTSAFIGAAKGVFPVDGSVNHDRRVGRKGRRP